MRTEIDRDRTALLIVDPQNDFLSERGMVWELVGEQVRKNRVVEHLVALKRAAERAGLPVFYSPHYFDAREYAEWRHLNPIDRVMFERRMFDVSGEGAKFLPELEPSDRTFVLSPHKALSGFWANDVQLQLRQRDVQTIILAGMSANLCRVAPPRRGRERLRRARGEGRDGGGGRGGDPGRVRELRLHRDGGRDHRRGRGGAGGPRWGSELGRPRPGGMVEPAGTVVPHVGARGRVELDRAREATFVGAVQANLDRLFSTAYRLTRDRADAEELVQETLLRAWARFDPRREAREILVYLYRILVNLARDRARRRTVLDLRPQDPGTLPEAEAPASDVEALRRLTAAEVRRALDALPEHYRLPILLADIDGFSYEEVGAQLGVPVGTVASRLRRGRLLLRRSLWRAAAAEGIVSDDVCREAGSLLAAYCRGETTDAERAFVEAHLARCLPCRDVERVEREVLRLVRERACREPAPPSLLAFVRAGPWARAARTGPRAPRREAPALSGGRHSWQPAPPAVVVRVEERSGGERWTG